MARPKPIVYVEKIDANYWRVSDAQRSGQGTWEPGWIITEVGSEKEARKWASDVGARIVKVSKNPGAANPVLTGGAGQFFDLYPSGSGLYVNKIRGGKIKVSRLSDIMAHVANPKKRRKSRKKSMTPLLIAGVGLLALFLLNEV